MVLPTYEEYIENPPSAPQEKTHLPTYEEYMDDDSSPSMAGRLMTDMLKPSLYATDVILRSFGYEPENKEKKLTPETVQSMKLSGDWDDYVKRNADWKEGVIEGVAKPSAENMQQRFASATGRTVRAFLEEAGEGYDRGALFGQPDPIAAASGIAGLTTEMGRQVLNEPLRRLSSLFSGVGGALNEAGTSIGTTETAKDIDKLTGGLVRPQALGRDLQFAWEYAGIFHPASYGRFVSPTVRTIQRGVAEGVVGVPESVWMGLKEPTPEQRLRMDMAVETPPTNAEKLAFYDEQTANLKAAIEKNPQKTEIYQAQLDRIDEARKTIEPKEPRIPVDRAVRLENPQLFNEFDAAAARQDVLRSGIANLKEEHAAQVEANAPQNKQIAELKESMAGKNDRQKKKAQQKIDALEEERRAWIDEQIAQETPEIQKLREGVMEFERKRMDLAEQVSAAYRKTREDYPEAEAVEPKAESYIPEQKAAPVLKEGEGPWGPIPSEFSIADDFRKSAVAAGRTAEQANAEAALVEAHYKAISEQGWAKGTPEEIYKRHMAEIISGKKPKEMELSQGNRGSIKLATDTARAAIKLFKSQNASSLVHELGHHWLDEMMTWAKAEGAPESLIKHSQEVRKWLGAKEGEFSGFTRTQHEKFARGFERYLMEGVAPSKELANVFAQFKDWMTAIYQTVDKLRSPITPEIRSVFDHMLSANPERISIVTEKPVKTVESSPSVSSKAITPEISTAKPADAKSVIAETAEVEPNVAIDRTPMLPPEAKKAPEAQGPNQVLPTPRGELVDKAGNIRLENLTDAEDVREGIRQLAAQEQNFLDARRGTVSDMEVANLADSMGVEQQKINLERMRELSVEDGIPLAARIRALRKMLEPAEIAAREAMQKVIESKGSDDALMEFADARRRFLMIAETVSGVTAEWGRAGRAFRDISKEQKGNSAALQELFQKMTGKTMEEMRKMAENPQNFDTPAKMGKYLQDSAKPGFLKMLTEYRMAAMLWGPRTHIKNFVSNAAIAVNSVLETALASTVGKVLKSTDRIELNEAAARWTAIARGSEEGWTAAKAILVDENAITGTRTIENVYQHAIPGKAGEVARFSFRALSAADELFKSIAYRQEINALATRMANKEGLKGEAHASRVTDIIRNPTEEMMEAAKKHADYQTLTKSLEGTALKGQFLVNSNFILKNIVPFYRTNINSLEYFLKERTVLGLASREVRDNLMGKNGERARDLQIARTTLGTAVAGIAIASVLDDKVTGRGPKDPQERALWLRTHQPYSVRVGDMWYSYEGLQGFSTPFGMAADIAETVVDGLERQDEVEKIVLAGVGALSKRLLEIASLQGVSDTVQAMNNPDQYFHRWLRNYMTSHIPNFVPTIASAMDPELREVNDMIEAFKSKTPFIKETLLPRLDIWGQPIVKEGALGPDVISPIFQSKISDDPVDQKLQALKKYPGKVADRINGVKLTEQQYHDYQKLSGRLSHDLLTEIILQPNFSEMPEFAQVEVINDIIGDAREEARGEMLRLYPEIIDQAIQSRQELYSQ